MSSQAKRLWCAASLVAAVFMLGVAVEAPSSTTRHYASNGNFDQNGNYLPGAVGFDVADIGNPWELNHLPAGVRGLVWVDKCNGVDNAFLSTVRPLINHPKLFGFYLKDDPDPTGRWGPVCHASELRAESDWIHARRRDALTFVDLMNLSSSSTPSFEASYRPDNSHVDLFGVSPYPCRVKLGACDYKMIDRFVDAALQSGVPRAKIVPVYQTFGCGAWRSEGVGAYRMPTVEELRIMLKRWSALAPAPVFDYAYSWGSQKNDLALESSGDLKNVISAHNRAKRDLAANGESGSTVAEPPGCPIDP